MAQNPAFFLKSCDSPPILLNTLTMKHSLFISLLFLVHSAAADVLYCEFQMLGNLPFAETAVEIQADGSLGDTAVVTQQGGMGAKAVPIDKEPLSSGEKFKFTLFEGSADGDVYVTVFELPGKAEGSLQAQMTNPPMPEFMKHLAGECVVQEGSPTLP